MTRSFIWRIASLTAVLATIAACTPSRDWREIRVDGDALTGLFPCRPERRERTVPVAGVRLAMAMTVCATEGTTYAIAFVDVADPEAVGGALSALREAAVRNIDGASPRETPFALAGTTPNVKAARVVVDGRLPDGTTVREHAAFFVRGVRVYQASVVGPAPVPEALETFFTGMKFRR